MDRPQREGRGRKGDKSGAIAKLREAQSGGKRRTEQYTAPSEEPIYEEVNDDHYEKIREGDNFVVDEGSEIFLNLGLTARRGIYCALR